MSQLVNNMTKVMASNHITPQFVLSDLMRSMIFKAPVSRIICYFTSFDQTAKLTRKEMFEENCPKCDHIDPNALVRSMVR